MPSADARGRGASYSAEHLSRLQLIKSLKRARPNILLSEIRILLQQLTPEQIENFGKGVITAAVPVAEQHPAPGDSAGAPAPDEGDDEDEVPRKFDWSQLATKLTGMERVLRVLREVSGVGPRAPSSRVEEWHRIAVTPDAELCIRSGFDAGQVAAFRELADLLRHFLENAGALSGKGEE